MSATTTTTEVSHSYSVALKDKDTITSSFNYWGTTNEPQQSELFAIFSGKSTELRSVRCPVTDIRPIGLDSFRLSTDGFQVLRHSSALLPPLSDSIPDFHDTSLVNGVRSAVAFNTTVRDLKELPAEKFDNTNPRKNASQSLQPFFIVHGDYTAPGARAHNRAMVATFFEDTKNMEGTTEKERTEFFRLRDQIIAAEEAAMKAEGVSDQWDWSGKGYNGPRWAMLSVWRPFETVHTDPLAVMNPKTLFKTDVAKPYVPVQRSYKARPGFGSEYRSENPLVVAPQKGEDHQWYYISQQKPEEVYALKLFDSEAYQEGSAAAKWVAHSAFSLPDQETSRPRRSAEVRMMVIW